MQKFIQNLEEAEKITRTIDHMTYVTYPLIKDKKLLLKILTETKNAIAKTINAILQYEYLYKRIFLSHNPQTNFENFKQKCAPRYKINREEIKQILEIFDLAEKHQKSTMEFVRNEKIVIMTNGTEPTTITIEKTKEFIALIKNILKKTKNTMNPEE